MIGDAEQYSVTAALMARELGFPARVVIGFVPQRPRAPARSRSRARMSRPGSRSTPRSTAGSRSTRTRPCAPSRSCRRRIPTRSPSRTRSCRRPPPCSTPRSRSPCPDTQQHTTPPPNAFLIGLVAVLTTVGWVALVVLISAVAVPAHPDREVASPAAAPPGPDAARPDQRRLAGVRGQRARPRTRAAAARRPAARCAARWAAREPRCSRRWPTGRRSARAIPTTARPRWSGVRSTN